MNTKYSLFFSSLVVFSGSSFAGDAAQIQTDLSEIKAVERQQIINELSYRLETKESCDLNKQWTDSGSGADLDGNFYVPSVANNVYIIGGFGSQTKGKSNCVTVVSLPANNPEGTPVLLVSPIEWKMIWNDKGSGAEKDGSMWEAIPPDSNYRCLGTVPQRTYKKPDIPNYRCVHNSLTEKVVSSELVWSDRGSNADKKVTMIMLPNSHSFVAVADRLSQVEAWDLKADPVVKPDPKRVDEILATRMAKIEKDLEASMQEKLAQKQQAEEAEKQRLAEEAEKKRLAEEAEQKRLAEEKEQKRLAAEAEKKKQAEKEAQMKQAAAEEQKQPAVETEQMKPAEKAEPVPMPAEPATTAAPAPANNKSASDSDDKESSAVNSLYIYLLKVFLVVLGAFLFLGFILYKIMKRSKG